MNEEWRRISWINDNYLVSNFGRVYSTPRPRVKGGILRPSLSNKGYLRVSLPRGDGFRMFRVHRLVLTAFKGPCPEGMESAHLDGVRTNNRLDNLAWVSGRENNSHKLRHGTWNGGENHPSAILTNDSVAQIREFLRSGMKQRDIAKRFGVCESVVSGIKLGQRWKHTSVAAGADA